MKKVDIIGYGTLGGRKLRGTVRFLNKNYLVAETPLGILKFNPDGQEQNASTDGGYRLGDAHAREYRQKVERLKAREGPQPVREPVVRKPGELLGGLEVPRARKKIP